MATIERLPSGEIRMTEMVPRVRTIRSLAEMQQEKQRLQSSIATAQVRLVAIQEAITEVLRLEAEEPK